METTYKTPTEEDKAKALKLLESLEEWQIAKETELLDVEEILDYIHNFPNNLNSIKLFLDIVNTKEEELRDKKLVDFILSYKDEDLDAFISIIWSYGIRFFITKQVKAINPLYLDDKDYFVLDLSKQRSKFGSQFCRRILNFADALLDPILPTSDIESFKEFKSALKTLQSENNYSIKRFDELVKNIYLYP